MKKIPNILLIYTGGTIGMIKDSVTGALENFNFNDLLESIPELNLLDCNISSKSFSNPIDSSNMKPSNWIEIGTIIEKLFASIKKLPLKAATFIRLSCIIYLRNFFINFF